MFKSIIEKQITFWFHPVHETQICC